MGEFIAELLFQLFPASLLAVIILLYERVRHLERMLSEVRSNVKRLERLTAYICSKLNGGRECLE